MDGNQESQERKVMRLLPKEHWQEWRDEQRSEEIAGYVLLGIIVAIVVAFFAGVFDKPIQFVKEHWLALIVGIVASVIAITNIWYYRREIWLLIKLIVILAIILAVIGMFL